MRHTTMIVVFLLMSISIAHSAEDFTGEWVGVKGKSGICRMRNNISISKRGGKYLVKNSGGYVPGTGKGGGGHMECIGSEGMVLSYEDQCLVDKVTHLTACFEKDKLIMNILDGEFIYARKSKVVTPPLSDGDAIKIVEEGANKSYILYAPTGNIMVSNSKEYDTNNKLFTKGTFNTFQNMEKIGLLKITPSKAICGMGKECYMIDITEKGKKNIHETQKSDLYTFKFAEMKISKIEKNVVYKSAEEPQEDFKVVSGVCDYYETDIGKEFSAVLGKKIYKQYKFKALVKYHQDQSKYEFVKRDWGYIDKPGFETNTIK